MSPEELAQVVAAVKAALVDEPAPPRPLIIGGHPKPVDGNTVALDSLPDPATYVWVVVAVSSNVVAVSQTFASEPMSGGRMGIFDRPKVETTEVKTATVLGVWWEKTDAEAAVEAHKRTNANLNFEYSVSTHTIDSGVNVPEDPEQRCIRCGVLSPTTRCNNCQQAHWAEQRAADPEFERA